jgi:hypothetical protein
MYPHFPPSVRKALCCLVLCLLPAGFPLCQATAQTASEQSQAAIDDSRDAGRDLSAPDENAGGASSFGEQFFGGSYTGAILFGYPAHGPGLPDLLLGCAAGVLLLRALRSRRQPPDRKKPRFTPEDLRGDYRLSKDSPPEAPSREQPEQSEEESRDSGGRNWSKYLEAPNERERQEMQQKARAIWDTLRSQPESSAKAEKTAAPLPGTAAPGRSAPSGSVAQGLAVPADFDVEDFLDGARMLYSRLQTSWAARDLEDLTPFATPEMIDLLRRQAEQDPTPGSVEVLLVKAILTDISRRGEEELVEVAFNAILQENPTQRNQGEKISVSETWQFVRGPATGGGWRLAGIRPAP